MAALAVFDGLPSELRDRFGVRRFRQDILDRLRSQTTKQAYLLLRMGDVAAALAYYHSLSPELREHLDLTQGRSDAFAFIRKCTRKEARQLQQAGDLVGALAVYDRLAIELRDHAEILHERGTLLHHLGQLNAARDVFRKAMSTDPRLEDTWHALGVILADLGRSKELENLIEEMVSKHPPTFEILRKAAYLAKRGQLLPLAGKLFNDALDLVPSTNAPTIVKTAETLLHQGAQGRVINLLGNELVRSDARLRSHALDLSDRALAQLRLAGRASNAGPIADMERADALVVRSVLEQANKVPLSVTPAPNGIAIVTSSLGAGGAQKQVVELIRQLCGAHRERVGPVFLLLGNRSSQGPEFHKNKLTGLDVTIEFMSEFEVDPQNVLSAEMAAKLSVLPPRLFNALVSLTSRLKLHKPEVVLIMLTLKSIPAMLAATIAGIPHLIVSERSGPRRPDELVKLAYRTVLAQNSAAVVTNSAATARDFAKWLEMPAERVGVIHNGVDVDELWAQRDPATVAAYRRSLGIQDNTRIVGGVFQARAAKRPQLWIEAASVIAKRAPDVAFVVVGDSLDRDDLSALLVEHGLESRFHRPGISRDVVNWLGLMDVVLLTSQFEGTPNVLLEAQALGRPVVATDVGGNAETFLFGDTGLLLSAHPTPEEVADSVIRVLDDPSFAARASEKGPKFIRERFNAERMAAKFVDLCFGEGDRERQRGRGFRGA